MATYRGGSGRSGTWWLLSSNELLGGLLSKRLQQTLHDRMLSRPELLGVFLAQPDDDGERGELRLRRKPGLDRGNVRVELGWHANPRFIRPLGSPVRGTRLAGSDRRAERARKNNCVRC